ncbi:MAG: citrate/2-methylcitrate synthase [Desulfobacterales bacterium]
MNIPTNMFPVMFAIGRLPGWIAQWKEHMDDREQKITWPRQIYISGTAPVYSHGQAGSIAEINSK